MVRTEWTRIKEHIFNRLFYSCMATNFCSRSGLVLKTLFLNPEGHFKINPYTARFAAISLIIKIAIKHTECHLANMQGLLGNGIGCHINADNGLFGRHKIVGGIQTRHEGVQDDAKVTSGNILAIMLLRLHDPRAHHCHQRMRNELGVLLMVERTRSWSGGSDLV